MNKRTYNSLKKILEEVRKEAWKKYCDAVRKNKPADASIYYEAYYKVEFLHIDLQRLVEDEEEAR